MRTTITLSDDVAAAIAALQREQGIGPSEAVNRLIRRGLSATHEPAREYEHRSAPLGLKLDVRNIGEVLELLDEERP